MALKAMLDKLDGVPESLRSEYKEQDGKFYLDIEGLDDHHGVGALKRAKEYEKEDARKAKEKLTSVQAELEKAQNDLTELRKTGVPKGDVEALENSYKDKYGKAEKALNDKIAALTGSLEQHLLDGNATKLAAEIAAKPEYVDLILPHIRNRLKLEDGEGGAHVVRVLDKDGKPSAANVEDLKKELLGNKAFAAILTGSKAAGGGANGGQGGGAANRFNKKFGDLTEAERTQWHREDAAGFKAASEAHRAELNRPRAGF